MDCVCRLKADGYKLRHTFSDDNHIRFVVSVCGMQRLAGCKYLYCTMKHADMQFKLDSRFCRQADWTAHGQTPVSKVCKIGDSTSKAIASGWKCPPIKRCPHWWLPLTFCAAIVLLLTICVLVVVREVERTRADVRPLLTALTPILQDANQMSSEMREVASHVLNMVTHVDNASGRVLPIVNRMFDAVNETANAVTHIETIARNPVVRINLEGTR